MTAVRVTAYVTDLMDRSKIAPLGEVTFAHEPAEAAGADVVVVDLGNRGDLVAAVRRAAPLAWIVGYGRHTDVEGLERAAADGADAVMPRSRFFADPRAALTVER